MIDRKKLLILLLILLAGRIFFLFVFPVTDPSEARYALIIKRMAATGNFLEPQLLMDGKWVNFEGKPPLFFQSGAVCAKVFGTNPFSVRFPALLAALGILAALYFGVKKMRDERTALYALLFCSFSSVFFLFSGLAMTDMTLNFAVSCAVIAYMLFSFETERKKKKWYSLGFFASLAIGMLAKGPVALVMAGFPIFVFVLIGNRWKELKDHAWFTGIAVFLAIAAPWFILMTKKNPDFLEYFFINENFKRFLFKEYGDRYGAGRETFRGMAVIWFLLCNLPAILWLNALLRRKESRKELITRELLKDPVAGLSFAGFLCITLFWSLTSRVLITYLLPTIPLFSIWLAERLNATGYAERGNNGRNLTRIFTLLTIITLIGFGGASIYAYHCTDKAPQKIYSMVMRDQAHGNRKLYFEGDIPFSAAFFVNEERLRLHADEPTRTSIESSREDLLFMEERHIRKYRIKTGRKELYRACGWVVFAPAE